ncbi:hypothetical protein [Kitasatospora sp. NBC_01266]|nr:hypothetical protein [Kitasatospora sp. NBC_01266]
MGAGPARGNWSAPWELVRLLRGELVAVVRRAGRGGAASRSWR